MMEYMEREDKQLEIRCNQCGRMIEVHNDVPREDVFHAEKVWGYFSKKDGKKHTWNMCEACYEKLIKGFAVPIEEQDVTELL